MNKWTLGAIVLVMGGHVSFAAPPPPRALAGVASETRIRGQRPRGSLREDALVREITLECEEWNITLLTGGYSDVWNLKPVDGWHCVDGEHEVLSGEWAAAIYYDGIPNSGADPTAPPGTAVWLTPSFLNPTWTTNYAFAEQYHLAWDNPYNPASGVPSYGWNDTAQNLLTNGEVTVQIDYEIADLGSVFASPLGINPGPETGQFALSSRYVLLQTYTITNISARSLSNVELYQLLHGQPGDEFGPVVNTVYDSAPYPDPLLAAYNPFDPVHTLGNFRYDITQWNSMAVPAATAQWVDWIGFSSSQEPAAFGNNFLAGHGEYKPPGPGAHWDVEARAPNGLTSLYGEVAGVEMWTLGTLNPDDSVSITVVLMSGQVDCNENAIPDMCDEDCNRNGIPDECDIADGTSEDCNENTIPDLCDIGSGSSGDCNGNGVPDECDGPFEDCTGNGIPDLCEPDCNDNGIADTCDLADGTSPDIDGNGLPDECQMASPRLAGPPHDAAKHRYISINATRSLPGAVAIRVEIAEMLRCENDNRRSCLDDEDCPRICAADPDLHYCGSGSICPDGVCISSGPCRPHPDVGLSWYVQEPQTRGENCPNGMCNEDDWYARVEPLAARTLPYSSDWRDECNDADWTGGCTTLHIGDCEIVPCVTYHVYACDPVDQSICSVQLLVGTTRKPESRPYYGDIAGRVTPFLVFEPPDGFTSVLDVSAYLLTTENWGTANLPQAHPTWIDLHGPGTGIPPQYILNVFDLNMLLGAFVDVLPYENSIGGLAPGDCP